MVSWRDNASPETQQELDQLLEAALGFAQRELAKRGEFYPYAVVVRHDGDTELVAGPTDETNDRPPSAAVVAACRTALIERRDQLRATALVANLGLPDGSDAVQVELEHSEGSAITVLLPDSKKRFGRGVDYGQLRAATGTRHVWL
jgi:hypothetical protein